MWCNAGAQAVGLHQQCSFWRSQNDRRNASRAEISVHRQVVEFRQPAAHDAIRQSPEQAGALRTSGARCRADHGCRPLSEKTAGSTNPLMPLAGRPALQARNIQTKNSAAPQPRPALRAYSIPVRDARSCARLSLERAATGCEQLCAPPIRLKKPDQRRWLDRKEECASIEDPADDVIASRRRDARCARRLTDSVSPAGRGASSARRLRPDYRLEPRAATHDLLR